MLMDPKKLSEIIRMKKKKMMMADPDVVSSEPHGFMNAQDVEDTKQLGRIETTLDVPDKSDSDETQMKESESDQATAGLTDEEKKRMGRLRKMFDMLDVA
jgi:hypothetical protein